MISDRTSRFEAVLRRGSGRLIPLQIRGLYFISNARPSERDRATRRCSQRLVHHRRRIGIL